MSLSVFTGSVHVSESLRLFSFNRVCACCDMLHNSDYDLRGTENECAGRPWFLDYLLRDQTEYYKSIFCKNVLNIPTIWSGILVYIM